MLYEVITKNNFLMPDGVLEKFVKEYIQSQNIPEIQFVWQGGEPSYNFV